MLRLAGFLFQVLGALLALAILAIVAFNVYAYTRPAPKTVRALESISISVSFEIGRPFIDYMAVGGTRLYAGYASHGSVCVIDTATNRTIAKVDRLGRVHGIALMRESNLGFASSSRDNNVNVFDLTSNRLLKKIPAGRDPDAILYDAKPHLVYVADHDGKAGILIDAATQMVVASIPLGGEPEYAQAAVETGLIYQNLEDTSELVVIDPQSRR
jgi:YVTN family beta-propeller protein